MDTLTFAIISAFSYAIGASLALLLFLSAFLLGRGQSSDYADAFKHSAIIFAIIFVMAFVVTLIGKMITG